MRNEDLPGAREFRCPVDGRTKKTDIEVSAMVLLGCKRCMSYQSKTCSGPEVVGEAKETKPMPPLPPFIEKLEEMAREMPTPKGEDLRPGRKIKAKPGSKPQGRKPEAAPEPPAAPSETTPTGQDVRECRAAIMGLIEEALRMKDIRTVRIDEMVRTLREELFAAKAAGVGWRKLAACLRQYGYAISENSLKRGLERAKAKEENGDGGKA